MLFYAARRVIVFIPTLLITLICTLSFALGGSERYE